MKFKRWRLSAAHPVVNASVALTLTFVLSACGSSDDAAPSQPASDRSETAAAAPQNELRAVWSTRPLDRDVRDIALSDGTGAMLAVSFEGSGLQMFNLEAERISEIAPYSIRALADGQPATIDGADVTIFPGVNDMGELNAYVYGDGLVAPVALPLPFETSAGVLGLCSTPTGDAESIMRLAFWTMASPERLTVGTLSTQDQEFVWTPADPEQQTTPIGACAFEDGRLRVSDTAARASALFQRNGTSALLTLDEDGALLAAQDGADAQEYSIRDGITITAPDAPVALAALGTAVAGGYPGGLIVIAGETTGGEHQAVFVDGGGLLSDRNAAD
ncbi:MAG: hypothetical protein AAFS03_08035 [Pseudomonadota bacterium]